MKTPLDIDEILEAFDARTCTIVWNETEIDGDPFVDANLGDIAIDIWPRVGPVPWKVRVLALEGCEGAPEIKGFAPGVEAAKREGAAAARAIVPMMIDYMLLRKRP